MERLLGLEAHLVKGEGFEDYKKRSTIDKGEFKRVVYGVNYQ